MPERIQVSMSAPPFPCPVVLVSAKAGERESIITLAWVGMVSSEPMTVEVGIRPSRFTFDLIMASGEFAVNVPGAALIKAVDACGTTSGRDVDKFEKYGLTRATASKIRAPLVAECPVALECRLKGAIDLGTHHIFLGEVLAISAGKEYVDGAGHFMLDKLDPMAYIGGNYRTLGAAVGRYGLEGKKLTAEDGARKAQR
jgi:flavin reductase (DIM6/NTAB) family NADH-FMN oxidoreductase RutF